MLKFERKPTIRRKREFIERWMRNEFGNRLRNWESLEDFQKEKSFEGLVGYRSRVPNSPHCQTHIRPEDLAERLAQEVASGATWEELYIGECPDDAKLLVQGEFQYTYRGPSLFYNTTPNINMRMALKTATQTYGAHAMALLRHFLFPPSFEDLMELTEVYPDAAVEFAAYSEALGNCPHRNMIVWEVRSEY